MNSTLANAKADDVDMSDPTAVYSSVGIYLSSNYTEDNDPLVDASVGFGWGNNLLSIETKSGMDAINGRYAKMGLYKGLGLYVDATYQFEDNDESAYALNVGGIYALKINETLQFYPIATVGYGDALSENDRIDRHSMLYTVGTYSRVQLGKGWSLGVDPFYTYADGNHISTSIVSLDTFVSYQVKTHQFRVGAEHSWASDIRDDTDGSIYAKYKFAF
ncbi:hypothetical protein A9264_08885 [Vibrio sp. UCD-FRSSP16_10]|uniref:hypothetical protein n=1 Tax=unclassified Vibrio TaxID=2614977 RepID=UPI0007FBA688|nr:MULTISPECIES: hypothetical protein [unclassified Vibrio]OBT09502.1 hypothetical protein A9260_05985 [Vibrio sp. UCD-FRSSP16_30]OBT22142.1 hypothetical protein A9264_08885 [Vibrio sp. UCD-FRSSP16_10]